MLNLGANEEDCPPYLPLAGYKILLIFSFQQKKKIGLTYLASMFAKITLLKNIEKRPTRTPWRKTFGNLIGEDSFQ